MEPFLHRVLERAVRGDFDRTEGVVAGLRRMVGELLSDTPDTPPPDLVYGAAEWRRRVADVVAAATPLVGSRPRTGPPPPASCERRPPAFPTWDGRWTELPLSSPDLRVRGRVDVAERRGDSVTLTDLKTGSPTGPDGTVRPAVALQLQAYGLIVADAAPGTSVDLRVLGGSSASVPFGPEERGEVERTLHRLGDRLPTGQELNAPDLARPGPYCRHCDGRHRCAAYQAVAPSWWARGSEHPIPSDVWGKVEGVEERPGATVDLDLRDVSGRRVRIANLRGGLADGVRAGDRFYAFGLERRGPTVRTGTYTAPLGYRDVDPDTGEAAWALATFVGDGPPMNAR